LSAFGYNGKSIGEWIGDAIAQHSHVGIFVGNPPQVWLASGEGATNSINNTHSSGGSLSYFTGNVSDPIGGGSVRAAAETRPASISASLYMKY
jgi:hypothetical protein